MAGLTILGTLAQVTVLVVGATALRRAYISARKVTDAAGSEDETQRPKPTTDWNDIKYMREVVTEHVLQHSLKQATGWITVLVAGAVLTGVAGVWGLFLPSLK